MSTFNDLLAAAKLAKSELPGMNGRLLRAFGKAIGDVEASDKYEDLNRECHEIHKQIDDAIAAAEREVEERQQPIDEAWLSKFSKQDADGFLVADAVDVWFGEHCNCWLARALSWGSAVKISSRGQLLDLLSGLGIEVAK